jgi:GDPmannose 4,6-dehydratase
LPAPKRALITGITGQDGRLLARQLLDAGYDVAGFGRAQAILANPRLRDSLRGVHFLYGDLADAVSIAAALQDFQPDELYNLASQSAPGVSWSRSVETGDVTGMGAHRVFEAVHRLRPECRVYQASSSEMFGAPLATPQTEATAFNPLNPYAVAKVYAHQMAQVYRRSHGMWIACGILFNHESPLRDMRFLTQKVALGAACAHLGIAESRELNEGGDPTVQRGTLALGNLDAARDWGYAPDYVDAMWRMLQQPSPDDYVIGTGVLRTVRELCDAAYTHVGLDWRTHVVSDPRFVRLTETGATVADASKARAMLGWAPTRTFAGMVAEMVDAQLVRLQP